MILWRDSTWRSAVLHFQGLRRCNGIFKTQRNAAAGAGKRFKLCLRAFPPMSNQGPAWRIICAERMNAAKGLLPRALPAGRIEGGVKPLACFEETVPGMLAGTSEVEGIVAIIAGTGVKTDAAQFFGRFRIFLTAIGANHDNARARLCLSDAVVAHG